MVQHTKGLCSGTTYLLIEMDFETLETLGKIGLEWDGQPRDSYNRVRFESQGCVFFIAETDMFYLCDLINGTNGCKDYDIERRERNLSHELEKSAVFLVGEIKINLKSLAQREENLCQNK